MKKIEIKYKDWKSISVKKYYDILEILNDKLGDDIDKNIRLITLLSEEDEDDILNLPINEFEKLAKDLEFLKQMPNVDIRTEYEINGKKYNVFTNLKKMTAGQYIDFQTYQKDYQKNMKYILSIFLIPQGKEYGDYDIDEVAEEIYNNLSILDAHSITLFFSLQFQALTKAIVIYLIKQMKKQMKKAKTKIMKIRIGRMIIQLKNYSQEIGVGYI